MLIKQGSELPRWYYNDDLKLRVGHEEILDSIKYLLSTPTGTEFMLPEIGTNYKNYLFENMNSSSEFALLHVIITAIRKWEPRVEVSMKYSKIVADYDNKQYVINLVVKILDSSYKEYSIVGEVPYALIR